MADTVRLNSFQIKSLRKLLDKRNISHDEIELSYDFSVKRSNRDGYAIKVSFIDGSNYTISPKGFVEAIALSENELKY